MRLEELEEYVIKNSEELLKECEGICREGFIPEFNLVSDFIYSDCDYCLLRSAVDRLNLPSVSLETSQGRRIEFIKLEDFILEVGEESAQVYPKDELEERISDLIDFGLINEEDARSLLDVLRQ